MTEDVRPILMDYLARHYGRLRLRLARLLGNDDLAGDALQDTWLRVQSRAEDASIRSPSGYLMRVAVNIAMDAQRRQSRALPLDEIDALLELADPAPGPAQAAETRSELEVAMRLLERLPERRRKILLLVRLEGLQQKEVAQRLKVSASVVDHELRRAHEFLDAHMKHHDKK